MRTATEMLEQAGPGLDATSKWILSWIAVLEEQGMWTWNLRKVAVLTGIFLLAVRLVFQHKRGVDWYALLHALVSSFGSMACVYLDHVAYPLITDTPALTWAEKMNTCPDGAALTSLHRLLPAITLGYSLFDLIDGIYISPDFAFHGAATVGVFLFFCELAPHFNTPMLLMEVSTIFLAVVRADFLSTTASAVIQALFALNFFLFRIVVTPYLWARVMLVMARERNTEAFQACYPAYFFPVALAFGLTFHGLNMFWFVKIVKKVRRKILGIEGIKAKNDIGDASKDADENGNAKKKR